MEVIPFEAETHLNWTDLASAIEAGHKLPRAQVEDVFIYRGEQTLLNRSAWIEGMGVGVKACTIFPGETPMINGAVNLFSDTTGALEAVVDFHLVTKWKTAGDSLLAATKLARKGSRKFLIVGAGTVGRAMVQAYRAAFDGAEFTIWNRSQDGAEAFARDTGAAVATDLQAAVEAADVVTCATMASDPVIKGEWLKAGQHLNLIGAYRPDMREADDAAFARGRVFVDSRETTLEHIGELIAPLASGAIARQDVVADYYQMDEFKRDSDDEITVFKNGGGAHMDLMVSRYILEAWRSRWVMTFVWFLIALIVVAAVLPIALEAMRSEPDEGAAPGKFADLPSGRTHYHWMGPSRGPVVVAIHGLTTPSPIWEDIAEGLGETAYRVLAYDLYGRGFSQAVAGRQDAGFFVRQLEELLAHVGIEEDVTLLGYSMGGAIAAAYGAAHPEQMQRVILLAPAGIEDFEEDKPWQLRPWIGGWWARVVAPFRGRAAVTETGLVGDMQRREFGRRGFNPSVLSSRRRTLSRSFKNEHRKIAAEDIPVMAIWGEVDDVIPMRGVGTLAQWNRNARQEVVKGAGHGLVVTHGFDVVALLREMLRD